MIYQELIKKINITSNVDLYVLESREKNFKYNLIFLSSLIDEFMLIELQRSIRLANSKNEVITKLDNIKISKNSSIDESILLLYEGQAILYLENEKEFILVDVRKIPARSISEPEVEKAIRGSKDGFNESIINNISLLRTRIKSSKLIIEAQRVGEYTKTSVCICYLEDKVNKDKLIALKSYIETISIESLVMTDRALESKLFNQSKTIFPLVRYTERPDVSAIYLLQGHIVMLVDTSSSAIITPVSLFDHMKNVEEYRQSTLIGNVTKIIRYIGIVLSVFFIPLCYLLAVNTEISNVFNGALTNESSIPLWGQFLLGGFIIELFRIAIVHTPNTLSSALSIVIGIILGEVSMSLGLFMKDVLLILSVGTIASFSIPSYELSLTNRILSFAFLIISIIFGSEGFLIGLICLFIHLISLKTLGYPYLYPLIPLDYSLLEKKTVISSSKRMKKV